MTRSILQRRLLPAFVFLVFAGALTARAATPQAPLSITGLGKGTVALGGDWQFHLGDNPAWASPTLDDSGWERIGVDKPWGAQTHFGYTGYAWYRRHLNFLPVAGVASDLALLLPPIDDAYEVYWNGSLIGHLGKLPPRPLYYRGLPAQIKQATDAAIAFGQDDDITVITLTRLAPGVKSTTSLLAPPLVFASA